MLSKKIFIKKLLIGFFKKLHRKKSYKVMKTPIHTVVIFF